MAEMRKLAVTLPVEAVDSIAQFVLAGQVDSVSGFVRDAVAESLEDGVEWSAVLDHQLAETGGPMSAVEAKWADEILGHTTHPAPHQS